MQEVSLVFDANGRPMGEVVTRDGSFASVTLSAAGEELLATDVKDWQTSGLPVMRDAISHDSGGTTFRMFEDRVLMRDAGFLIALSAWMRGHDFRLLTLPTQGIAAWEKMSALPLTDIERYSMMYAFCALPEGDIGGWITALEEAGTAVRKERVTSKP
jgi:hypothetical protein